MDGCGGGYCFVVRVNVGLDSDIGHLYAGVTVLLLLEFVYCRGGCHCCVLFVVAGRVERLQSREEKRRRRRRSEVVRSETRVQVRVRLIRMERRERRCKGEV